MRRTKWARPEKRLLWLSTIGCGLPLGLSGLYEWNNRVPEVQLLPRVVPKPNAEEWFLKAATLYVAPLPNRKTVGGDWLLEGVSPLVRPIPYTANYNRIYALAPKTAFLRSNAPALSDLRRGLQFPYAYRWSNYPGSDAYWSQFRAFVRLLIIESHARAQQNDWRGAANSLLDAYHLICLLPTEAPDTGLRAVLQMQIMVRRDFWALMPHLSAAQCRNAAGKIGGFRSQMPSLATCLSWEKRCRQETMILLIKQRDFRLIETGFPFACADLKEARCVATRPEIEAAMNQIPRMIQLKLSWMNKPQLMHEMTRHLDWQIAEVKKPYPLRAKKWPEPKPNDDLDFFVHPSYSRLSLQYAESEAQDALLSTSLALRAFRLENGRNARTLSELVPRYLPRVPLDPCSSHEPLRYKNQSKRFVKSQQVNPKYANSPFPPGPPPADFWLRRYETVPFTLYSLGLNARDDGGKPYEDANQTERLRRYVVNPNQSPSAADIVAGINN